MKPNEITVDKNKIKENWLARSGLLGQAAQGAEILARRNQLAAQIGEKDFFNKLTRGLQQAIAAGAVSGTAPSAASTTDTPSTPTVGSSISSVPTTNSGITQPNPRSAGANVRSRLQANRASRIKETDNSNEYLDFSKLIESVILNEAPILSMTEWLQKFVEKQIELEKLPELDEQHAQLLKSIASDFEKKYYKSKMVPTEEVKKLFSFLQNWESTNARIDPYYNRGNVASSAISNSAQQDPRRAIATELLRTPLNGSDSYKGLREIISSLIMNTSLQNPLSLVPLIKDDIDILLKQKQQQQAQQQNPAT